MSKSDELLERMRELIKINDDMGGLTPVELFEIVEQFKEMDRYLTSGGPFPMAWHESARRTLHPSVMSDDPWQAPESALKGKEPF